MNTLPEDLKNFQPPSESARWPFAILAVIFAFAGWIEQPEAEIDCITDSECFAQCERELKRPCTDEDVFGPEEQ